MLVQHQTQINLEGMQEPRKNKTKQNLEVIQACRTVFFFFELIPVPSSLDFARRRKRLY